MIIELHRFIRSVRASMQSVQFKYMLNDSTTILSLIDTGGGCDLGALNIHISLPDLPI
jgi:hypothetical protein